MENCGTCFYGIGVADCTTGETWLVCERYKYTPFDVTESDECHHEPSKYEPIE